jgi:predicted nucleic acid-binding protein
VIALDHNLLLYAYDRESPFHERARSWWEDCLSTQEPVGLTYPTLCASLRISTNAKIYSNPMTLGEAAGHVRSWTPIVRQR